MSNLRLVAVAVFVLASSGVQLIGQSADPRIGTWILKDASRIGPDGAAAEKTDQQAETLVYQPTASGFRWVVDAATVRGRTHSEVDAKLDGAEYPVRSENNLSVVRKFRQLADRTYAEVTKVEGMVTATRVVEVSADGNTLTAVDIATNNPAAAVLVFQKQK